MKLNSLLYRKSLPLISIIVMLFVSAFISAFIISMVNFAGAEVNSTDTYFFVDPPTSEEDIGNSFTVDINVTGAPPGTQDWQISIGWNASLLNVTDVTPGDFFDPAKATGVIYEDLGAVNAKDPANITIGQSLYGENVTSGAGRLCNVTFLVEDNGISALNLFNTGLRFLGDPVAVFTEYPNNDGFFRNVAVHDVAVTSVSRDVSEVVPAGTVTITVTVENEGNDTETFDVEVYADVVTHDPDDPDVVDVGEIPIATYTVTGLLEGDTDTNSSITWTPGDIPAEKYYLSAEAVLATDDDPHDNIYIDDTVTIDVTVDIKVTDVTVLTPEVYVGDVASINVTVLNQGNTTESSVNVTIYRNGSWILIAWLTSYESLDPSEDKTLTFTWDTTGVAAGTYDINATVPPVAGERDVDKDDNWLVATLIVKPVHDIAITNIIILGPNYHPLGYYWTLLPGQVWVSEIPHMAIYLWNQGTEEEVNFTLAVYADVVLVYNASISLASGNQTMVFIDWDTTYNPPGIYNIVAHVPSVWGEVDTADNRLALGTIQIVVIPGDMDFDGDVDSEDFKILAGKYGQSKP